MALSLEEHIQRSKEAVAANKAKGNRHAEILSGLYSDPKRFLDELIQNAEDAMARNLGRSGGNMLFDLYADRLDVYHDGKDFDEADLMAITTFAGSTKGAFDDINQIGKFGIGFRSVYSITDKPEIHSGPWHFRITDHEVLEQMQPVPAAEPFGTLIRLPFKADTKKQLYRSVRESLKAFNAHSLLFLDKVQALQMREKGHRGRSITCITKELSASLTVKTLVDTQEGTAEFLCVKSKEGKEDRFSFCFAMKTTSKGALEAVPLPSAPLFVYFPTMQSGGLDFLFHAAFTTNPTREHVPFDAQKAPENGTLLNKALSYLAACLIEIREAGYLDVSMLSVLLPSSTGDAGNVVSDTWLNKLLPVLERKKMVPTQTGHECSKQLVWTDDPEIMGLLERKALSELFLKREWLAPGFNQHPAVRDLLAHHCGIKQVDAKALAFRLAVNEQFLVGKSNTWLTRFYNFLGNHPALWDELHANEYYSLRTKAFLKLKSGIMAAPYLKDGRSRVYLPSPYRSGTDCVDRAFTKDEGALNFFHMLGLKEHCKDTETPVMVGGAEPDMQLLDFVAMANAAIAGLSLSEMQKRLIWAREISMQYIKELYKDGKGAFQIISEDRFNVTTEEMAEEFYVAVRKDLSCAFSMTFAAWQRMQHRRNHGDFLILVTQSGSDGPKLILEEDPVTFLEGSGVVMEPVHFIIPEG